MLFCCPLVYFKINILKKNSLGNNISVSNILDPDQAPHFVGPDLGPNCLQRLSADNTSRQRVEGVRNRRKKHRSRSAKKFSLKSEIFSYPSVLTFVLGAQKNRLIEMVLLSTHNICFG